MPPAGDDQTSHRICHDTTSQADSENLWQRSLRAGSHGPREVRGLVRTATLQNEAVPTSIDSNRLQNNDLRSANRDTVDGWHTAHRAEGARCDRDSSGHPG